MTPAMLVAVIDDAIAASPKARRRDVVLELRARGGEVLGVKGKYLGTDEGGPTYGFTRRQCEEIRGVILAAAAEDAGRAP